MIANMKGNTEVLDRMLKAVAAEPSLSREQEADLCRAAQSGDCAAAQALAAANLSRVVHLARQHRNQGVPMEDLIHEGALGLLQAIPRFDATREVRFFTYASFLVRRNMVQAISRGAKMVRVPRHVASRVRNFRLERERLSAGSGGPVSIEETARSLGLTTHEAEACANFATPYELSVDQELGEDESRTRADYLAASPAERPDAVFDCSEELSELRAAMEHLNERDRLVLECRFGLCGEEPRTLRDLSSRMNLSKERVRQLEERAKRHVREAIEARLQPGLPQLKGRQPGAACA